MKACIYRRLFYVDFYWHLLQHSANIAISFVSINLHLLNASAVLSSSHPDVFFLMENILDVAARHAAGENRNRNAETEVIHRVGGYEVITSSPMFSKWLARTSFSVEMAYPRRRGIYIRNCTTVKLSQTGGFVSDGYIRRSNDG